MKHADVHGELGDYLEGDLPLERRALIDAHLDGCPDCAGRLHELRATVDALRSLGDVAPPPGFAEGVMARIAAGEGRPSALTRLLLRTPPALRGRLAPPLLALASAAIVIVWLGVGRDPATVVPAASKESIEEAIRKAGPAGAPAAPDEAEAPAGPKVSSDALEEALQDPQIWAREMLAREPSARAMALALLAQHAGSRERLLRLAAEIRPLADPGAQALAAELERIARE